MSNLNHTQTIDRSSVASDQADQIHPTNPDLPVQATEEPYLSLQSEARWYGDSLWEFLVPAELTGGKLSVFQATMPEGFSPPRHIHTREDEVFLVLEGEAWFDVDGERQLAGPGTSVYMPRGVPHTFRIKSPVARMLGIMTPGAFEQLFRNLSVPASERTLPKPGTVPFDVPTVMAQQTRLGTQVVGPPMAADEV
jgi:quercetin dioxygenase-like cupin family protein